MTRVTTMVEVVADVVLGVDKAVEEAGAVAITTVRGVMREEVAVVVRTTRVTRKTRTDLMRDM